MSEEDNKTLWCGNLSEQVTEELLYELFLQAGPLEKVRIARDKNGCQKNFAFITFCHDVSVPYAINLFRGTSLFQRTLALQCRARMATLPPPIRGQSLDQSFESLNNNGNIQQQFVEMTQSLQNHDFPTMHHQKPIANDHSHQLIMASLQGNWSNRHHPYKNRDNGSNDRHRGRDDYHNRRSHRQHGNEQRQHGSEQRHHRNHDNNSGQRYQRRRQNY